MLVGCCDADWTRDRTGRKSTTRDLLHVGYLAVGWRNLNQSSVAPSTSEAKFISTSEVTNIVVLLCKLLRELDSDLDVPTPISDGNKKGIVWSREVVRTSKYVFLRRAAVKENILGALK